MTNRNSSSLPFKFKSKALEKEYVTVKLMIELYCHKNHRKHSGICHECLDLLDYAKVRLSKCPHYASKIPCSKCAIHCYKEPLRSKIREVMAFSGRRMVLYHPFSGIMHFFSKFNKDRLKKNR